MQYHNGVHLEPQVHGGTGVRVVADVRHIAVVIGFHLAEPVQVGGQVFLAESVLGQFIEETGEAVAMVVIMGILVSLFTPALFDQFGVTGAADGIVPSQVITDNRGKYPAHVREQNMTFGQ